MLLLIFAIATITQVVIGAKSAKKFLAKHKTISSPIALNDFKAMARNNMKRALAVILIVDIPLFIYGSQVSKPESR